MITPTLAHGPAQAVQRTLPAQGPRTRLRLDGPGTEPQIRAALTRAWRLAGQPLIVVVPTHRDPVGDIATAWAAEHAVAGIRVEHRTTDASSSPCVVVPADGPVPWCGCVEPPCSRCLDEPVPCRGCTSPLCPDHAPPPAPSAPLTPLRNSPDGLAGLGGTPAYPRSLRTAEAAS